MPKRTFQRWAIVDKASGKVVVVRNMRHGHEPNDARSIDPERHEAVKVGGDPARVLPGDVQPGMIRVEDGFAWPGGKAA